MSDKKNPITPEIIYPDRVNTMNASLPQLQEDIFFAASTTEMTGLIPGGMPDDTEIESYENVYPYLPPKNKDIAP